jgi:hypothetical protein
MKKTLIIALAVLVSLGLMSSTAFAGKDGAGKAAPTVEAAKTAPQGGEVRPHRGEGRRGDWLKRFDTDGDGKLSDVEKAKMEEARKERMKKIDTDGDGEISQEERDAARKQYRKRERKPEGDGTKRRERRRAHDGAKKREKPVE